jgi:hypothetical protein
MIKSIVAADLAAMSKVAPEIAKLETDSEWWLGLFGIDKSSFYKDHASWTWPRWRDPMSNPVTANMRLQVRPFQRDNGEQAIGVVLVVPEEDHEQYVGWASHARAEQVRSWVEFFNSEIVTLWSLWDAAGRPTGDSPPASQTSATSRSPAESQTPAASQSPAESQTPVIWHASAALPTRDAPQLPVAVQYPFPTRDDRIGRRLANGRFEVTEWLGCDWLMGAAVARDHEQSNLVRLTFSGDVAGSVEDVRAMLTRDVPGLAPVVYLGESASDDGWGSGAMMMAERLPGGAIELELPTGPGNAREIAAIGARLAGHILRVHRAGMVLGTLRPESTFVTATGEIDLLVRGERLWLMPRPNMTKPGMMPPWRFGYHAPELFHLLPLLRDPAPAADVFSLGVMLASALLGEFVYSAQHFTELFVAQQNGTHLPLPETPLGQLLTRCLRRDPVARPSLEEVERALLRQPD